nr:MAG: hypothetical protein 4 [Guangxi cystovirus 7]QYF49776.1 MAG: hypothetical protein 4 [Guangxi cystovirus 15]
MTIITKESLAQLRKKQWQIFHEQEPGTWFNDFSMALEAIAASKPSSTVSPLYPSLSFGNKKSDVGVTHSSDSDEGVDVDRIFYSGGWDRDVVNAFFNANEDHPRGAIPAAAMLNGERYAAGMTIVTGGGNTGKTPFLHALAAELGGDDGYAVIRFGEPLSGYNSDIQGFLNELSIALSKHRIIVIDSLKDIINSSTGAAAVGGLSRAAFSLLSDLGSIAATRGCVLLSAMNPSSGTERVRDEVLEAVVSNATTVILPTDDMGDSVTWKVISRTGEGLERKEWTLSMSYGDFSVVSILNNSSTKARDELKANQSAAHQDVDFQDKTIAAILKRY